MCAVSKGPLIFESYGGKAFAHFDLPPRYTLAPLEAELFRLLCASGPNRTRAAYAAAIGRLAEFCIAIGFRKQIAGELIEFAQALDELDTGTVRPFLKPAKAQNRANDPGDVWAARTQVAIAVDVLIEAGAERSAACRAIVETYPPIIPLLARAKVGPSRKSVENPAETIAGWHKRLKAGQVKPLIAQISWADRMKLVEATGKDLKARGEEISYASVADAIIRNVIPLAARAAPDELIRELESGKKPPSKNPGKAR